MAALTDQMAGLSGRVGAIESEGIDENSILSRVFKIYGEIEVSATVTITKHTYRTCSTTIKCATDLII